jgi:hypothetical protein
LGNQDASRYSHSSRWNSNENKQQSSPTGSNIDPS